ncbi:MAG: sensor diguanylate cyclase [Chloroflexota bacterium]|nr:sensor diguanylate cyclase [Chloroflexota bacterium]
MMERIEPPSTAAAVEALVRSIEAKEVLTAPRDEPEDAAVLLDGVAQSSGSADAVEPLPPEPPDPVLTAEPAPESDGLRPPATGWAWSPTSRGPLPGLVDRQLWKALVLEEAERQDRYGHPTAIVLAELVGLDELVARMGPAAMNRFVPVCADMLVSLARSSDRITRLTNSRFGLLLLETDVVGAARLAARITVAAELRLAASTWPVRMVVGWAGAATREELRGAVRAAEEHLNVRRAEP